MDHIFPRFLAKMLFPFWETAGVAVGGQPSPFQRSEAGFPPLALLEIAVQSLFFSLWILTTCCSWKKGCLAKPQLPSSPHLSKSPRTCMTRGASWWMSMHVGCWNFWEWGIAYLCLGCLRWDHIFLKLIHCQFATFPPQTCFPPCSGGSTLTGGVRALIYFALGFS